MMFKELRQARAAEDASKRKPAGAVATEGSPGTRSGSIPFQPPEELTSFGPTQLEEGLRRVLAGPDTEWLKDHHAGEKEARWGAAPAH